MRYLALLVILLCGICVGCADYNEDLLLHDEMEKMDWADAYAYTQSQVYEDTCLSAFGYAKATLEKSSEKGTVIMDLDQTIFDGVGFNSWLERRGESYSLDLQVEYMEAHVYDLMPGALEFIGWAKGQGYRLAFVTNRKPILTKATEWHLRHYCLSDIPVLYRTGEKDKTSRIMSFPNVVLTIGDKRGDSVEGIPHVYLPNPIY